MRSSVQQLQSLENAVGVLLDESRELGRQQQKSREFRGEQTARLKAEVEGARAILTSFVGEFRAFREEQATRASAENADLREIMTSFVAEFRAFRGEEARRTEEVIEAVRQAATQRALLQEVRTAPVAPDFRLSSRAKEIFSLMSHVR